MFLIRFYLYVSVCHALVVALLFAMYCFYLFSGQVSLDSLFHISIERLLCASVIGYFHLYFVYFSRCRRVFSYISYL